MTLRIKYNVYYGSFKGRLHIVNAPLYSRSGGCDGVQTYVEIPIRLLVYSS